MRGQLLTTYPDDVEDRDAYMSENVFWVPSEARWSYLQANAKQPSIGKIIDDAMIFKDWFVDLGPIRAKAEGRAPYWDTTIWSLFPDDIDQIPQPNGWVMKPLGELASKIGSGSTPTGGNQVYVSSGTALIRSQNIHDDRFVWNGIARITDTDADKLRGVEVLPGDILINITGDSILRSCVVDADILPARVNQHVSIIRVKAAITRRFVHQYLVLPKTKAMLLGWDAGGSRAAITKAHLERLPILLPKTTCLKCSTKRHHSSLIVWMRIEAKIAA